MIRLRWPTGVTAKLSPPRQNFLSHGKTFSLTAKLSLSRQNFLSHGKTFSLTAKLTFSRQNFLSHGKTFFLTAKLCRTFPMGTNFEKGALLITKTCLRGKVYDPFCQKIPNSNYSCKFQENPPIHTEARPQCNPGFSSAISEDSLSRLACYLRPFLHTGL